jgi:hypothetical protein
MVALVLTVACDRAQPLPALAPSSRPTISSDRNRRGGAGDATVATMPDVETADDQDDPRGPACLPHSRDVSPWAKVRPVRVAMETAGPLMADEQAERVDTFRIKQCSRCTYQHANGAKVHVTAIETDSVADAFGLLSVRCDRDEAIQLGTVGRVERGDGDIVLHAWQGRYYLQFRIEGASDVSIETHALASRIAGLIPAEQPPDLLAALPSSRERMLPGTRQTIVDYTAEPATQRLLRDLAALPDEVLAASAIADPRAANALIGLDGETLLAMRDYKGPDSRQSCRVWVARYANERAAQAAYDRIAAALGADETWSRLRVLRPQKQYLIGTFTAEEESLLHVMPGAAMLLPSA